MAKATWDLKRKIDEMLFTNANPIEQPHGNAHAADGPLSNFRIEDFELPKVAKKMQQ